MSPSSAATRRLGTNARAADSGDFDGGRHCGSHGIVISDVAATETGLVPPRSKGTAERVAGTDRVDNLDRRDRDLDPTRRPVNVHAATTVGVQHQWCPCVQQHAHSCDVVVRREELEIVGADLDDIGALQHPFEAGDVADSIGRDAWPAIGIQHHQRIVADAGDQCLEGS